MNHAASSTFTDHLGKQLRNIHSDLKIWLPNINRISVALYDPDTGILKTFINSTDDGSPLDHYEIELTKVESLKAMAERGVSRTINDMTVLAKGNSVHTRKIMKKGYLSSHTAPIMHNGVFHGFVFFNASVKNYFSKAVAQNIGVYAQLVGMLCLSEISTIRTLQAAVRTVRDLGEYRDEETGGHLNRMAHFARMIAKELADSHGLDDEFIEFVHLFAPLHDIGKIALPDEILLKKGPFTPKERAVMQTHVVKGAEMIDKVIVGFRMETLPKISMLKNVVLCHHEAMDGTGYPRGLGGQEIPLEGRITAVADVFDALTSVRPYKKAWTNDEAFAFLKEKSATMFDPGCVNALLGRREDIEKIQQRFHEEIFS